MRKQLDSDEVERLLSDEVSDTTALLNLIKKMPGDKVFSTQSALSIIKKLNSFENINDAAEYEEVINNLLARCSYDACKYIAPKIRGDIRKHTQIILQNQEIAEKLFSTNLYETLKILMEPISPADLEAILPVFMQSACKYTNMEQLKFIYTKYNDHFTAIAAQPDFIGFKNLLSAAVESNFDLKFNIARQYSQFGGIDYDGMLTLCAALHEKKIIFYTCDFKL